MGWNRARERALAYRTPPKHKPLVVGPDAATLEDAYRNADNQEYLIVTLHHEIHSSPFGSGESSGQRFYQCRLSAIPASAEFRPLRDGLSAGSNPVIKALFLYFSPDHKYLGGGTRRR